jgi:hypothetical protein
MNVMAESPVYPEILNLGRDQGRAKGQPEGRAEGLRKAIELGLEIRFGAAVKRQLLLDSLRLISAAVRRAGAWRFSYSRRKLSSKGSSIKSFCRPLARLLAPDEKVIHALIPESSGDFLGLKGVEFPARAHGTRLNPR